MHAVARGAHAGLVRALERRGRSIELPEGDALASEEPLLATVLGASAAGVQVLGAAPGQRTTKLVRALSAVPAPRALGAQVGGVDVHAERAIDGRDRAEVVPKKPSRRSSSRSSERARPGTSSHRRSHHATRGVGS